MDQAGGRVAALLQPFQVAVRMAADRQALLALKKGMRERLLAHPRFGPGLRLWVEKKQISRKGKVAAISGIVASAALTAYALGPRPLMWAILGGLGALCAYLATRAEPAPAVV